MYVLVQSSVLDASTLNNWPKPINPGPTAQDHPYNPNSPLTHTTSTPQLSEISLPLDCTSENNPTSAPQLPKTSLPHDCTPENNPTSINPKSRKRIRKEFGRLGRNLRQRLFCGLFQREITDTLEIQDEDSIMGSEETSALPMDTSIPQDPSRNAGFWEADPNQLPKEP